MPGCKPNPEECDATGDESCNIVWFIKNPFAIFSPRAFVIV